MEVPVAAEHDLLGRAAFAGPHLDEVGLLAGVDELARTEAEAGDLHVGRVADEKEPAAAAVLVASPAERGPAADEPQPTCPRDHERVVVRVLSLDVVAARLEADVARRGDR